MPKVGRVLILALCTAAGALTGGGPCSSALDCQLNGACIANQCKCTPAWTGANCSTLSLLPARLANGFGAPGSPTSSWGAGIVHDPATGLFTMFNDEITHHCGLGTWGQNSHCILSTSPTPEGPYRKVQTVLSAWCHGSSIARDPLSGRFVLNHMANGAPRQNCTQCATGVTPPGAPSGPCADAGAAAPYTGAALLATSATGPYSPAPGLLNGGNCETFFTPNGTVIVACPWGGKGNDPHCTQAAFLTVSTAANLEAALAGAWVHLPLTYSPAGEANTSASVCMNWEDQNIWVDANGNFHTLMHAWRGQNTTYPLPGCNNAGGGGAFLPAGCTSLGGHAFSEDGAHWYISPVPAYTSTVLYEDGSQVNFRARERPHLLLSPAGDPLYFVSAVGDPGKGGNTGVPGADHTFTLVQQVTAQ